MSQYEIRDRSGSGRWMGRVRATSIEGAADIYARRVHGRRAIGRRVTGASLMSGCFRAYIAQGSDEMAVGDQYHVVQA